MGAHVHVVRHGSDSARSQEHQEGDVRPESLYLPRQTDQEQKIKETHVNLPDLLDAHRSGATVTLFRTKDELAAYTIGEGRYFPKEEAYAGGVLKFLLREIHNPYRGKHRSSKRRGPGDR